MAKQIIDARIKQKTGTFEEWNNNPLILLDGEVALVRTATGALIQQRVGDGYKTFAELPDNIRYDQSAFISVDSSVKVTGNYTVVGAGTYGGVTVGADKIAVLYWNGTGWVKNFEGDLPSTEVIDGFNSTDKTKAGSADNDRVLNNKLIVKTNDIDNLNPFGDGKSINIPIGDTGFQKRVGVRIPSNYNSRTIAVTFTSNSNLRSTLFWQRVRAGDGQNWITPIPATWVLNNKVYTYTVEITSNHILDEASNVFLFINNETAVVDNTNISLTAVLNEIEIKDITLDNKLNIEDLSAQVELLNTTITDVSNSIDEIDNVLKQEDVTINVASYANRTSYVIPQGSLDPHRLDWNIPKNIIKEGDVLKIKIKSITGANPGKSRIYRVSTSIGILVFTFNTAEQSYLSQEINYTITDTDLLGGGNLNFVCQTNDSNPLNSDTISIDYSIIFREGKYVDVAEIENNVDNVISSVEKTLTMPFTTYKNMTPIVVKKVGGQFATIQEAINSITNASVTNQYDVQVWDDYEYNQLTDLYNVNARTKVTNPTTLTSQSALIITKDWVHIRGMGAQRKIRFVSPLSIGTNSVQYVQVIYPMGNCIIDNFHFSVKGGRYAVHQESGGSTTHMDYFATTISRNMIAEHEGNEGYPQTWASQCAQANGTSSGSNQIYENCSWISPYTVPFYIHSNKNFSIGNKITFKNCNVKYTGNSNSNTINCSFSDMGSGQVSNVEMYGCNFVKYTMSNAVYGNETERGMADLWQNGGANLLGFGNAPMILQFNYPNIMQFSAINASHDIEIVGGTAKDLIFGDAIKTYKGGNVAGRVYGNKRIWIGGAGNTSVYSLQYRLGNCADNPKTLIVKVNGVEYTVTFNKNYMTTNGSAYTWNTVPAVTQATIISDIRSAHPSIFTCDVNNGFNTTTYPDCQSYGENKSNVTIPVGRLVVRDYANGYKSWRLAQANEVATGISGERINPNESGNIVLLNKVLLPGVNVGLSNVIAGNYYKSGSDGTIVSTTDYQEALFVAIDGSTLSYIK